MRAISLIRGFLVHNRKKAVHDKSLYFDSFIPDNVVKTRVTCWKRSSNHNSRRIQINGISGANTQTAKMGLNQATDSYGKNIQSQIANAQKRLQELSANEGMTLEEKMKKRQEIQQQISDLNMQLRQHQIEQRKERQQAKGSSMDEMPGGTNAKAGSKSAGLSQASMTAMISAGASIKQSKVQGSVAVKMEDRAGVLESEIKLETGNDVIVAKKKEELADVTQQAQAATASQMNTLAEANQAVEEAAAAERTERKASDAKEEAAPSEGQNDGDTVSDAKEETAKGSVAKDDESGSVDAAGKEPVQAAEISAEQQTAVLTHVDVRL